MATADIIRVGTGELDLIARLYAEMFRPARPVEFFERRLEGRTNVLMLVAQIDGKPVGFAVGYENKPRTFYCWLIGVHPDVRRAGIASQLMEAMAAWARDEEYEVIRFESFNRHRPMLHLAISHGYDIVGIRYDRDLQANLIIMELDLSEEQSRQG